MAYKIRRVKTVRGHDVASLTVPGEIAGLIPPDMRFNAELTQEGILYRPARTLSFNAPDWAQSTKGEGTNDR